MWVFSEVGFFSVVEDWEDESMVYVRARWRKDLEKLKKLIRKECSFWVDRIKQTPGRDYHFRLHMNKRDWASVLSRLGESIDYGNFKGAILDRDPERERAYMRVWEVMREAADTKAAEPWGQGINRKRAPQDQMAPHSGYLE